MSDDIVETEPGDAAFADTAPLDPSARSNRVFLCVVDNTEECINAIYFAACRARRTGGRLALLYIMEPAEFQHWIAVEAENARGGPRRGRGFSS